jgi:hypothetical protein
MRIYEQQSLELSLQVTAFEAVGQTEERAYFPVKARQLAGASASGQAGKECSTKPRDLEQM